MLKRLVVLVGLLALAACDGDGGIGSPPKPEAKVAQPQPAKSDWQIGPWLGERNYSVGLPLHPTATPDGGFYFDFGPGQSPHYILGPVPRPLAKATRIRARFKVEGDPGTVIYGQGCPTTSPSAVTLFFSLPTSITGLPKDERVNWSADGGRWWAGFARHRPLKVGEEFEIVAPFDGPWKSVLKINATDNPDIFARDRANAGHVGFTFANCEGSGHGATATGKVRFSVLYFAVE